MLEIWGGSVYYFNWTQTAARLGRNPPMSLINDVRREIKAAKKLRVPGPVVVCVIIASFLCAQLFEHFGKLDLVLPTLNSMVVLGFTLVLKQKLWRRAWFWVAMGLIAVLHVPLILFVPWTTKWTPALVIAAIDSLDFCLILWILAVIGKLMRGPKGTGNYGVHDRS